MLIRKGFKRDFLLFLATAVDIYEDWFAYYPNLKRILWRNHKTGSLRSIISKMVKFREIEKTTIKGEAVYRLTNKSWRLLDEVLPIKRLKKKTWDGKWTIVIFDIPEERKWDRDNVRQKLKTLGFGCWQLSVYISPHDLAQEMREYFGEKQLSDFCACLTATRSEIAGDKKIAEKVFNLKNLNRKYEGLLEEIEEIIIKIEDEKKIIKKEISDIWKDYKEILLKDPFLPKDLLPDYWLGNSTRKEFYKLLKLLKTVKFRRKLGKR